ncbi:phosphate starvation-inducible protein PhoH [Fructilactobacillus lindneri]|nr:PhoH family protein [Fructilactobacillus lindneri]ANZ58533.1 phosphate starvation-inducible protein PhoH [Fructilactobacillus lindneri]ANZ59842.1 phosphate starvation-inducible protein PhoH [Fructilactobacillus lindneri]POG98927.1 phosphate starvation-inducible protein PhoH [Fructilactobacillus lindneri]POH03132.1 phosphate starvation-inducible protein PhoH [Fructilactobacillus lindneri]POH04314.1 phosphate starvation-inducible protein PhoH [Fructilactobacillus lindneri]
MTLSNPNDQNNLFGTQDSFINVLENGLSTSIRYSSGVIKIEGHDEKNVQLTHDILLNMLKLIHAGINLNESDFVSALNMARNGNIFALPDLYNQVLIKDNKGKPVRVKNFGQKQYIQAIKQHDITFGIGPAGTGKTYLAVVMAVAALKKGQIDKIVLTRPAVEAGESLGFLPGDLKEKVDPYLRPLYDSLYAILGRDHTDRLLDRGVIEIAPLAYMRGRTLDNAFVILDEAQNTTNQQMKMFLTRLGFGSKMIVNGDIQQIDLKGHIPSGLVTVPNILKDIKNIEIVRLNADDVVRNPVVAKIITAYENHDKA